MCVQPVINKRRKRKLKDPSFKYDDLKRIPIKVIGYKISKENSRYRKGDINEFSYFTKQCTDPMGS